MSSAPAGRRPRSGLRWVVGVRAVKLQTIVLSIGLGGCSSVSLVSGASDSGAAADLGDADADGGGEGSAGAGLWWTLSGALELADGAPLPAAAALDVRVLDDAGVELCVAAVDVDAVGVVSPPEPVVFGWWELTLGAWDPVCTAAQEARPMGDLITVGVGALHPEIAALLPAQDGLSAAAAARVNGAYAQLSAEAQPVAFGIAGPAEAFAGASGPWTEGPLPDGALTVQAVYRFASAAR